MALQRAYIFNTTLRVKWPEVFEQALQVDYLDYYVVQDIADKRLETDPELMSFLEWLVDGGECPIEITTEAFAKAEAYADKCIKKSLENLT